MDEAPFSQGTRKPSTVGLMAHLYNLCWLGTWAPWIPLWTQKHLLRSIYRCNGWRSSFWSPRARCNPVIDQTPTYGDTTLLLLHCACQAAVIQTLTACDLILLSILSRWPATRRTKLCPSLRMLVVISQRTLTSPDDRVFSIYYLLVHHPIPLHNYSIA